MILFANHCIFNGYDEYILLNEVLSLVTDFNLQVIAELLNNEMIPRSVVFFGCECGCGCRIFYIQFKPKPTPTPTNILSDMCECENDFDRFTQFFPQGRHAKLYIFEYHVK
jgi:hypothetical protein